MPEKKFARKIGVGWICLVLTMVLTVTLTMVLTVALWWAAAEPAEAKGRGKKPVTRFTMQELEPLLKSLERDGFARVHTVPVFYDRRLRKLDRVVAYNAVQRETRRNYDDFTNPYAKRLARRFMNRHWRMLHRIERKYGVPKQIITAILLVETQFGRARLPYRVLEVLTTLAVESTPESVGRHFSRLKRRKHKIDREWLAARLMEKAEFAYRELVAVLSMFKENLAALYHVRGSYAGAIGIPQFLPSSYLRWAVDGNGDGRVNLNNLTDAMHSVANFLRQHGWRSGAHFRDNWKAVWEYNNSDDYVRAIHEIAFRLYWQPKRSRRG